MIFRDYIKEKFKNEEIIEFGPLNRPLFNKEECKDIKYADIRSTEEIKKLYSNNDYLNKTGIEVNTDTIVDIDYKIIGSYINTFKDKKFNVAYLSHVIEHMPDIINFFNEISEILKDDGRLIIIYPDKRYCFDHFRNSTSFRDAYATYKYGTKENARIAFDFAYNVVHENDPKVFWDSIDLINIISKNNIKDAEKYYEDTLTGNIATDDVHFWPFSDIDFLKFIYEMKRADLFNFEIEEFYPTQYSTQEFMIILKKSKNNDASKILELINKYDDQTKENFYKIKIENEEKEIMHLKHTVENIRKENETLKVEREETNKNYKKLREKKEIVEIQNNQMKEKIRVLEQAIKNYEESKSWKITRPIRKLSKNIAKIRRKNGN